MDDAPHPALSAVRRDLAAALAVLEEAGAIVVAAHVAAALDALDTGQTVDGVAFAVAAEQPEAVSIIARRMQEEFGAAADSVARRQLAEASGATLLAWAAIVNRIGA